MLHKTFGIVLRTTNYAESSVIAKIYTEKFGLQAYIINGVKKPRAKIRMNMLQVLSLLDLVVYHKQNISIQRIAEARSSPILQSIPYDIVKSCIGIFINEMLYKSLKQPAHEPQLFGFLQNAILFLDQTTENCANFSLVFLLKLSGFLGFKPDTSFADTCNYFDLLNGGFVNSAPAHPHYLDQKHIATWRSLLRCPLSESHLLVINAVERRFLLTKIIMYYTLHLENFGVVNSHLVLEEVLR